MSEQNFSKTEETPFDAENQLSSETDVSTAPSMEVKSTYQNRTARLLNRVYITLLVLTVVNIGFQIYISVVSYGVQFPLGALILLTAGNLVMPLTVLLAVSFLFKFFAEIVEQLDRKNR